MQISDLMKKGKPQKGVRVKVRVPTRLKSKLGENVKGEFVSLVRDGRSITIKVKLDDRKGVIGFRPQDVEVS